DSGHAARDRAGRRDPASDPRGSYCTRQRASKRMTCPPRTARAPRAEVRGLQADMERTGFSPCERWSSKFLDIYEFLRMMAAMSRKRLPRPTDSELAILRVLWERGPATVRSVNESLPGGVEPGYTTTLKLMQIMVDKGLLTRDDSARSHVYTARV